MARSKWQARATSRPGQSPSRCLVDIFGLCILRCPIKTTDRSGFSAGHRTEVRAGAPRRTSPAAKARPWAIRRGHGACRCPVQPTSVAVHSRVGNLVRLDVLLSSAVWEKRGGQGQGTVRIRYQVSNAQRSVPSLVQFQSAPSPTLRSRNRNPSLVPRPCTQALHPGLAPRPCTRASHPSLNLQYFW